MRGDMGKRTFQDIIEAAGLPTLNHSAGFGEECLAFTYEGIRIGKYIAKIVAEIRENADQEAVVEAFRVMRENNLGHAMVVYFPGIAYQDRRSLYNILK